MMITTKPPRDSFRHYRALGQSFDGFLKNKHVRRAGKVESLWAATDSPLVWLRWFSTYRGAVWDDEWEARGIEKMGGSWGFCGDNLREPMLEILESMTRDQPNSRWFDDRRTPVVEDRDAVLVRSFQSAVASITKDFGDSVDGWRWRNFHKLKIGSLLGDPRLERIGGPVPGTPFTVNPGDNIGTLGGGASWRMIVDFGNLHRSVGVYPGGQSEDPQSPHYDDQMKLWEKLQFVDLNMVGKEKLPASAVRHRWTLNP
ncbi:MAG: penicillin acylase family protein [Planctomycetota bacterium]